MTYIAITISGCVSEEGLIMSSQFERSPRRWRMLFENWDTFAPLLLFNRETDLITSEDIFEANSIREKFFPMAKDHPNYKSPPLKGTHIWFESNLVNFSFPKVLKTVLSSPE